MLEIQLCFCKMVAHPVLCVKYNLSTKNYIISQILTHYKNLNTSLRWRSAGEETGGSGYVDFLSFTPPPFVWQKS